MKRHIAAVMNCSLLLVTVLSACSPAPQVAGQAVDNGSPPAPATSCESLNDLELPDAEVVSAVAVTSGTAEQVTELPEFCRLTVTAEPQIGIEIWMPIANYNGRFQAVGGGGFAGELSYTEMGSALRSGYATASTDTGHNLDGEPGAFALASDGTVNSGLIDDFAFRSLLQLTEKSKSAINRFYGQPATFSYWNGCSTGGRQGMMLAQQYPDYYDGILAGAPAINWDRFLPAALWPLVVMREENGGPIGQCKFDLARAEALSSCDHLDGNVDGILSDPGSCNFDVNSLVGTMTLCGPFTAADAKVIESIWEGPTNANDERLWYGFSPSADLSGRANGRPTPTADGYSRYWVEKDPDWDVATLDYQNFEEFFDKSRSMFGDIIGTDNADLTQFADTNAKLIMWHGWEDRLINPLGTVDYVDRVIENTSEDDFSRYARLFMVPGVDHCGGGTDPEERTQPAMFDLLTEWVENGQTPPR